MDKSLKSKVLKKISPTIIEAENIEKEVFKFKLELENSAKELNFNCDFFIGGSFGKNTYLKDNFDVDIFCRFDLKYEDCELSKNLKKILYNLNINYKNEKGSRDYFKYEFFERKIKIDFEIIPIRKIKKLSDAINSTDQSPGHVIFLKEKLKLNKNLCDEIRLAKQFFKAKNLYGAESYIGGFSGHVIDNLIIYYKSLENLILEVKNWEENTFLDVNKQYSSEELAMKNLTESKSSNLILVDPIIKNRNAARAISSQKYFEFLYSCNRFEKFCEEDFIIKKISLNLKIKKWKTFSKTNDLKTLIYDFEFKENFDSCDIVGSKMLRLFRKLNIYFEGFDFEIFKSEFNICFDENRAVFIFLFENTILTKLKKINGPKVFMNEAIKGFLNKNKDIPFIENDRVCIYKKRKITNLDKISNLKILDCEKFLEKDVSFIKSIKLIK